MRRALLVSRHPEWALQLARRWSTAGDAVAVLLLDWAAAAVRVGHPAGDAIRAALDAGVAVGVHDDALRRRGVDPLALPEGVKLHDLDEIADLVSEGSDRVVWL